jgi:hypothetical protein
MGDRELWRFINSFAGWLSALGTIAAVIVALYLARQDSRIRLKVVVGLRLVLQENTDERPEFFSIDVTNVGRRPANIINIIMRDGLRVTRFGFGRQMVMRPPVHPWSARVPTTLADGERGNYLLPWPEFEQANGEHVRGHFAGRLGPLRARLFRVGVATSAGGIFDVRIERPLAARFLELARRPVAPGPGQ